jgi:hypothetical protein
MALIDDESLLAHGVGDLHADWIRISKAGQHVTRWDD